MKYDPDRKLFVIDERRALPVTKYVSSEYPMPAGPTMFDGMVQHTRQAIVNFENRWSLSIIWGDMTYSSNHDCMFPLPGRERTEFTDEPDLVEVGIFAPEPVTKPAQTVTLPAIGELAERSVDFPERQVSLWGDPLAYVDAEALWWLATSLVSRLDSHDWLTPRDGPYIERLSDTGPFMLTITIADDGVPIIISPPVDINGRPQ